MFDTGPDDWAEGTLRQVAFVNEESLGRGTAPDLTFGYIDISQIDRPGVCSGWSQTTFADAPSRARRVVQPDDILVSTVRPYLRAFAKVPASDLPLIASTGFAVVRARAGTDQEFLFQHILSERFVEHLRPRMTGSNYPAVSADDVAQYPLWLPIYDEQRRIGGVLRSIDDAISAARGAADSAERVFCSLRTEMIERAREEFDEVLVSDALSKNRGEKLRKLQTSDYREEGTYPIVDQGARFIGGYTNDEEAVWPYALPVIVFGDHTLALKFVDFPFVIGADGTQCLTPNSSVLPRYFFYALQALDLSSEGYARHFKLLKQKTIPLPDEKTQREIETVLLDLERARDDACACIDQWETLKRAVSDDLLSGRVRVPG